MAVVTASAGKPRVGPRAPGFARRTALARGVGPPLAFLERRGFIPRAGRSTRPRPRCLIAALLLACFTATVEVTNVVDGDTFDARVPVWLHVTVTERIRVLDVDAKERREPGGVEATAFTRRWLATAPQPITVRACRRDSFGRVLGRVGDAAGGSLAEALRAAGHAKP